MFCFFQKKTVFHGQYEPLVDSKKYQKKVFHGFPQFAYMFSLSMAIWPGFFPALFSKVPPGATRALGGHGTPNNGWSVRENPSMDDDWVTGVRL